MIDGARFGGQDRSLTQVLRGEIMKKAARLVTLGAAAALLAGCATGDGPGIGPREGVGAVGGAVAGGLLGSTIGGGSGRTIATVAGAVAGGLLGGAIGRSLDEQDRQRAREAEYRAYAFGQPAQWRSAESGYYGEVVPYEPYRRGGQLCRDYAHTVYIDGRPQTARGTACEEPGGTWRIVG